MERKKLKAKAAGKRMTIDPADLLTGGDLARGLMATSGGSLPTAFKAIGLELPPPDFVVGRANVWCGETVRRHAKRTDRPWWLGALAWVRASRERGEARHVQATR